MVILLDLFLGSYKYYLHKYKHKCWLAKWIIYGNFFLPIHTFKDLFPIGVFIDLLKVPHISRPKNALWFISPPSYWWAFRLFASFSYLDNDMCYNTHSSTCFFVYRDQYLYRKNTYKCFCWIKSLLICCIARHSPAVFHKELEIYAPARSAWS